MTAIAGKHTLPKRLLRRQLATQCLRYRLHLKHLLGRPDIVFARVRVAVFCDRDFWHGRNLKARLNRSQFKVRRGFWIAKIEDN